MSVAQFPAQRSARLGPETRPDIVGTAAQQQIEALALRGHDGLPSGGASIGRCPVAVGEIAVISGVLDHAVQRDVLDDFELPHLSLRVLGFESRRTSFPRLGPPKTESLHFLQSEFMETEPSLHSVRMGSALLAGRGAEALGAAGAVVPAPDGLACTYSSFLFP